MNGVLARMSALFHRSAGGTDAELSPELAARVERWKRLPEPNLSATHGETRYVVVDVESSGLDVRNDRLISIGAVSVVGGRLEPADAFQVILRQDQVSADENILIHGIGGSEQIGGQDPCEALIAFLEYIEKSPLVAYHAFFDQAMIDKSMRRYLGFVHEDHWIDLAWVLPDLFRPEGVSRQGLDEWLRLFGIENIARHNAVSDAFATAQLLQVVISASARKGADSPLSLRQIEKARRWMQQAR